MRGSISGSGFRIDEGDSFLVQGAFRPRVTTVPRMFPSTHWTLLAQATLNGDSPGREALSRLCENYRPPVVAYLRMKGLGAAEAEDLAQDLFARLLTSRAWKRADPARGKFRTFLLGIVQHVLSSQWARSRSSNAHMASNCCGLRLR